MWKRKQLCICLAFLIVLGLNDNNSVLGKKHNDKNKKKQDEAEEKQNKRDTVPDGRAMPPLMDPKPTIPKVTDQVYFDFEMNGKPLGRVTLGLFGETAPKAVRNFLELTKCDLDAKDSVFGKPLCYKNTKIHRAITNFMIQGGDITNGDGTGGESIYDGAMISGSRSSSNDPASASSHHHHHNIMDEEDDYDAMHFNRRFLLAMVNRNQSGSGRLVKNTKQPNYGSQFFITVVKTQWLDTSGSLIFGIVLEGEGVIKRIESYGTHGGKIRDNASILIKDARVLPEKAHVPVKEFY